MESSLSPSALRKLAEIEEQFRDLEARLSDPAILSDGARYRRAARERGRLSRTVSLIREYRVVLDGAGTAEGLAEDPSDPEIQGLAREEIQALRAREEILARELEERLISAEDEDAERNVILEIRAGTGGEEAALFAADLFRMYARYAEAHGLKVEVLDARRTDLGGLREVIASVQGEGAHAVLRYESGGHRVQRIPQTEAAGRIHTSAVTVAVLPEPEEVEVEIRDEDLRVETFAASGPGGQHVNKTHSAVRITHLPTHLVVSCQDEKSQHMNRARAMRVLRSRLYDRRRREQDEARASTRRSLIGSGDRSERIRTYNFPQNRVTDHRVGFTIHDLEGVLQGGLDPIVDALRAREREERLRTL
ncbi:MAG: peptide chain release factor 1 [Planctomycetes bacterium]|nr:peptide chain release factor 1 [Planctomycetota bacterium]